MTPWILLSALYLIGGVGLYATACDVNGGPIKTRWKRWSFLVWPLIVITQAAGDLWDKARGDAPNWLR